MPFRGAGLVAPAGRRQFCAAAGVQKIAGGTPALPNPNLDDEAPDRGTDPSNRREKLRLMPIDGVENTGAEFVDDALRCITGEDKVARSLRVTREAGFHQSVVAKRAVFVEVAEAPATRRGVLV